MNRDEALEFLKVVKSRCEGLNPTKVYLDESKVNDSFVGYRIVIEGVIESEHRKFIDLNVVARKLTMQDNGASIEIYRKR